jgi:hypothetical protein
MTQATGYARTNDLADDDDGSAIGRHANDEFDDVSLSIGELIANQQLLQRDDGKLANLSVHPDALTDAVLLMMSGWTPRGLWASGADYAVNDVVESGGFSYVALVAHHAGATFAADDALDYWQSISGALATAAITSGSISGATIAVVDSSFSIKGSSDPSKIAKFEVDGFTTGTTRTFTLPNTSDTLVTLGATQTLTAKSLTSPVITGTPTASGATWGDLGTVTTAAITTLAVGTLSVTGNTALGNAAGDVSTITGNAVLTGGTVTVSTPVLAATQTWNDAAVAFDAITLDVTNTNSSGSSNLLNLKVGGTTKARVNRVGDLVLAGSVTLTGGTIATGRPTYSTVPIGNAAYNAMGTDAVHVAGTIYVAEIFIPRNVTITGVDVLQGGTVGSDKLIGILYDSAGAVLANSALAGVNTVGANTFLRLPFTAPYSAVGPARYWIGVQCNGTTDGTRRIAASTFRDVFTKSTAGAFGTAAVLTPPTSFSADVGPIAATY